MRHYDFRRAKIAASPLFITTEIESLYNESWRIRGILHFDKTLLQDRVLRCESFHFLDKVFFSCLKTEDIPVSLSNRIEKDSKDGILFTCFVKENDGEYIHLYETDTPQDALLLRAISNILLQNYLRRRPKRIRRISDLREAHYEFLKKQTKIESLHQVIVNPLDLGRHTLQKVLHKLFKGHGLIQYFINDYIKLPVLNRLGNHSILRDTPPPLGDITICLYHLAYQEILERKLEKRFPNLVYTRWGNEVIILNPMESSNSAKMEEESSNSAKMEEESSNSANITEIVEFINSLPLLSCSSVTSIYSNEKYQPDKAMFYGFDNPHSPIGFTNKKNKIQIFLHECGNVCVQKTNH